LRRRRINPTLADATLAPALDVLNDDDDLLLTIEQGPSTGPTTAGGKEAHKRVRRRSRGGAVST
jgi:hypothetical protein